MTLAEARADLIAQATLDLDLYMGITLDAEGNAIEEATGTTELITRACHWWQRLTLCSHYVDTALTLTIGDDTYEVFDRTVLSRRVFKPTKIMVNGTYFYRRDRKKHGFWTMEELSRFRPAWRDMDNGTPDIAVFHGNRQIILSAPPSGVYTGTNFLEGFTLIDDLVSGQDDDDELPGAPDDHPYIVQRAVVIGSVASLTEAMAGRRLADHNQAVREMAKRRKQENLSEIMGHSPRGSGAAGDWMY